MGGGIRMDNYAVWAQLEAKPGKEKEVEQFLKSAQPLAEKEQGTTSWYAVKIGPSRFAIFDTFKTEKDRAAHLAGEIAKKLFERAKELFEREPEILQLNILAAKAQGASGVQGDTKTQSA
jgi:quinol monooxygenase YgiN